MRALRAAIILITCAAAARASGLPDRINYQGKLVNPVTNNPQAGPVSLTFKLYNVPSGGTALYTETQNNVPLTNGVFAVQIGTQTAASRELFLGASVYLGVTVVGDAGGEMVPRQQLVMSAYAFTAHQLSDGSEVRLVAGASYSTFTAAGNLAVPSGVSASSGSFTNGVTASSGTFTALGNANYSITTSSGINMNAGMLDASGSSGINATGTGIVAATGTFSAWVASASGTFSATGANFGLTVSSGIVVQQGTLSVNGSGGIDAAGTPVLAGQFFGIGVSSTAVKTAAQSVTNSATLTNDAFLSIPIGANQTWAVHGLIEATSTSATPDIKVAFTLPTGSTVHVDARGNGTTATSFADFSFTTSGTAVAVPLGASVVNPIHFDGYVASGGTAGAIQVQWAQNTSNGTATTVNAGSILVATRVK